MVRVLIQSLLTALFAGLVGFIIWDTVVQPQLIAREKEAGAQAQQDRVQLRKDLVRARAEKATLDADVARLRGQSTTLESQKNRLTADVDDFNKTNANVLEEKRKFDVQLAELTAKLRAMRTERATLEIESKVLTDETGDLTKQSDALQARIRKLSRTNATTLGENRKLLNRNTALKKESAELNGRVNSQKQAVLAANARLIRAAQALKKERDKLKDGEDRFNESREALADGLAILAKEFRKIAIRNVGLVRERYTVLAEDKEAQIAELDQEVVKLDLGEDVASEIIEKLSKASTSAALFGKRVKVIHTPGAKAEAGRIQELLLSAGIAAAVEQAKPSKDEKFGSGVSYFSANDKRGAEQVGELLASAKFPGFEATRVTAKSSVDLIIWVGGISDGGGMADLPSSQNATSDDDAEDKELKELLKETGDDSEDKEDLFQEPQNDEPRNQS